MYKIVTGESVKDLQRKVNKLIAEHGSWQPSGPPMVTEVHHRPCRYIRDLVIGVTVYHQPMFNERL